MLSKLDLLICKLTSWLSKKNIDISTRRGFWFGAIAIGTPLFAVTVLLTNGFFPPTIEEFKSKYPEWVVPVNQASYVVSYEDFGDDKLKESEQLLWSKKQPREMLVHSNNLDNLQGKTYWIGVEVPAELVKKAREQKAFHFLIGSIFSTKWEMYIDSTLVKSGGRENMRRMVFLNLEKLLDQKANGFKLAIRIKNDMEEFYPDTLHFGGFGTDQQHADYLNNLEFEYLISTSMAFGFNFALGIFFLALWLCGVRKQELAAFAAFGLLQAYLQGSSLSFVPDYVGFLKWYKLSFVCTCYEALVILWLGFSISRIRSKATLLSFMVLFLLPWGILLTDLTSNQVFAYIWQMSRYTPYTYWIAALICFSQARLVSSQHRQELVDSERVLKLHLSWVSLFIIGSIVLYGNANYQDYRIIASFLLLALAAVVVHDYRKQELFIRKAPLSKYHQRAKLPEKVSCVMATIDLKSSESLYAFGSANGAGGAYVVEIISKFYTLITERGGEVIQTEGDSITFFFDLEEFKNSFELIIKSIRDLDAQLKAHLIENRSRLGDTFPNNLRIRAAIDAGAIKPSWQHFEGRDVPSWEQTSDSNIFVDVARLLEAESKVGDKLKSSMIVKNVPNAKDGAAFQLKDLSVITTSVVIKHGRSLDVKIASFED